MGERVTPGQLAIGDRVSMMRSTKKPPVATGTVVSVIDHDEWGRGADWQFVIRDDDTRTAYAFRGDERSGRYVGVSKTMRQRGYCWIRRELPND